MSALIKINNYILTKNKKQMSRFKGLRIKAYLQNILFHDTHTIVYQLQQAIQ